ncbi:unnamed protein product [Rotaria sordida]|uniref:Uncharacterized protein n=1 Tax=Rotaria sordida TaxID=392033 RepID=A0A814G3C6_9BILA|nr:unnamed protein product [Rotaria sordida]CAF0989492.1 unnamed protein product [Rotaria sordida]
MQIFTQTYQLNHRCAPWRTFRYTINDNDKPLYQVRRSRFRKYRRFEDVNGKILFNIDVTTIKSHENDETLANMQTDKKVIDTIIGNFTLTNVDLSQRNYILKINDNIVVQVERKDSLMLRQHIIRMIDINVKYQAFLFALLVLIDSVFERILNNNMYSIPMYTYIPVRSWKFCSEHKNDSYRTDNVLSYRS